MSGVTKCISGESQQSVELKMLNTVTDNQTYQNHKVLTLDNFGSKIATISPVDLMRNISGEKITASAGQVSGQIIHHLEDVRTDCCCED